MAIIELHWGSNWILESISKLLPICCGTLICSRKQKNGKFVSGHSAKFIDHRRDHNALHISVGVFVNASQIRSWTSEKLSIGEYSVKHWITCFMLKTEASSRLPVFPVMRNSGAFYPFMTANFLPSRMWLWSNLETENFCPITVMQTCSAYKNPRLTALKSSSSCLSGQHVLHRQWQSKLSCTALPMWLGLASSPNERLFYPPHSSALDLSSEPAKM